MKSLQLSLLYPFIFLNVGILFGFYIQPPYWAVILPVFVGIFSLAFFTFYSRRSPSKNIATIKLRTLSITIIFITVGMLSYKFNKADEPASLNFGNPVMTMLHVEETYSTTSGERLVCRIISTYDSTGKILFTPFNIRALLFTTPMSFMTGDILMVPFRFQTLKSEQSLRQNGYTESLIKQGITVKQFCDATEIHFISYSPDIIDKLTCIRDKLSIYIENSGVSHRTASFLITILLGDKTFLPSDIRTTFTQAGLAHILALSGLHVTIIITIIMVLLLPFNLIWDYKKSIFIALLLLWTFTIITGANYSTLRSCLMITSVCITRMVERKNSALNALFLSTMIILIIDPTALWNIGMQLSFISVAAILLFTEQLNPFNKFTHPNWHKSLSLILVCLITTATTLPLCALYFKFIPLHFLITNLVVLPLLPTYIVLALTHFLLIGTGLESVTIWLLDRGYELLYTFSNFIAADGTGTIKFHISTQGVGIYLLIIIIIGIILNSNINRKRKIIWSSCSLFCIGITCYFYHIPPQPDGIIIQNNFQNITLIHYINDDEHLLSCPMGQCTMLEFPNYNIVIADGNPYIAKLNPIHCDILIIGRNCQWSFNLLYQIYSPDLVVIHSSLLPHLRKKIVQECEANRIPVHSLAEHGSLAVEFTKTFVPDHML